MTPTPEEIKTFWPIVVTCVIVLIWLIRLEAKVLYQGKDHEKLEDALKEKDKVMWEKFDFINLNMNQILQAVSRLEGKLSNRAEVEK